MYIPDSNELLINVRPSIRKYWDSTKNVININNVKADSAETLYFRCTECGETWESSAIEISTAKSFRCPYCPYQKPKAGSSLLEEHPEIVNVWDYQLNRYTPDQFTPKSNRLAHFICDKGHRTVRQINIWVIHPNCPVCTGKQVLPGYNDLASRFPEIAAEWDYEANGDLRPDQVTYGSHKKIHWKCSKGHKWITDVLHRTTPNFSTGCPHCKAANTSYPEQFIYWSLKQVWPDTVNRYKLDGVEYDIIVPSIKLALEYSGGYWHKDRDTGSTKEAHANHRGIDFIEIYGDYKYDGNIIAKKSLVVYNPRVHKEESILTLLIKEILTRYNKSTFVINFDKSKQNAVEYSKGKIDYESSLEYTHPHLAADWDNEKNLGLSPKDVSYGSMKHVWWKCAKCGYTWSQKIQNRTINNSGCPNCHNIKKSGKPIT